MDLDTFSDYSIQATRMGRLVFRHSCGWEELLELPSAPVKFQMVRATEHHMDEHGDSTPTP